MHMGKVHLAETTMLSSPAIIRSRNFIKESGLIRPKHFTRDEMFTMDDYTIDSTGQFLIGELERLDPTLHEPLAAVTWGRDIDLREDVTLADDTSSFTNSSFASPGGITPAGKAWISSDTNAITGVALDIGKTANPLFLWGMEIKYTLPELASSQKLGRPIDTQKYDGMRLKYQMDIDEQVYIGDTTFNRQGLLNSSLVTATNVVTVTSQTTWAGKFGLGSDAGAQAVLNDVNTLLTNVWASSGYTIVPTELRLPPVQFGQLLSNKVSAAGNVSALEFLRNNSLSNAENGQPLNIKAIKWLTGRGNGGTDRMFAYTKDRNRVRFPLVPLQRTPLEYRSLYQITTYYGRLGVVEWVYPETAGYADGI